MKPCPKRANECCRVAKKIPRGQETGPKTEQKVTRGQAVIRCGCQKEAREANEASVGAYRRTKWAPEVRLGTKRKQTSVQKVPKKWPKSELLKKTKIELSLQRELNPACPKTPPMEPQNWLAHRKHRNEACGAQESTVRSQAGTKRDPVPP